MKSETFSQTQSIENQMCTQIGEKSQRNELVS